MIILTLATEERKNDKKLPFLLREKVAKIIKERWCLIEGNKILIIRFS